MVEIKITADNVQDALKEVSAFSEAPAPVRRGRKPKGADETAGEAPAPVAPPSPAPAPTAPPVAAPVPQHTAAPAPFSPPVQATSPTPLPNPAAPMAQTQTLSASSVQDEMIRLARAGADLQLRNPAMGAELQRLLASFGATTIMELKPENYPAFADALRAMGAAV